MTTDAVLQMIGNLFWTGLVVSAPVLGITMLVGIAISVVQVVTQIHDTTLTFVPKLVTAGIAIVLCGGWMLRKLVHYSTELWSSIPGMF